MVKICDFVEGGNVIQTAQDLLRITLSYASSFQTFLGVGTQAAALAKVYNDELPKPSIGRIHTLDEITALRPCAIVFTASDSGWMIQRDAMGETDCWHPSGVLHCLIFRNVPAEDKNDLGKCDTDFRTSIGLIVDDLIGIAETSDRLAIDRITARGPFRTDPKELKSIGDAQVFELVLEWGHR